MLFVLCSITDYFLIRITFAKIRPFNTSECKVCKIKSLFDNTAKRLMNIRSLQPCDDSHLILHLTVQVRLPESCTMHFMVTCQCKTAGRWQTSRMDSVGQRWCPVSIRSSQQSPSLLKNLSAPTSAFVPPGPWHSPCVSLQCSQLLAPAT